MIRRRRADRRHINAALRLAALNQGLTGENPSVGCLIIDASGHLAGIGVTAIGGRPHAEEIALEEAGERARGATAYVTLEPCRERSSGAPSCSHRLIEAGLVRIVCAIADPHPLGQGGLARLRAAGLRVDEGPGRVKAAALYRNFFRQNWSRSM
jgi:diaminohydroxyphosphoribosylaminopyrimidine deaminase/5-amino-6-(5-phosphoribosylamino)uracil reductase